MKQLSIENIYSEIMLLSDDDRVRLYARMQKEIFQKDEIVAYTVCGSPLTKSQYIEKINRAIDQAERGELLTDKELQKEIDSW